MRLTIFLALVLSAGPASAIGQCDTLRAGGLQILSNSTFDLDYTGLLNGCFAGYIPREHNKEEDLYRFGVFRDGKLVVQLPLVEAGMDLSSSPYNQLKILAVSFSDVDRNGQRDVTIIGERLAAKGMQPFVQIYWGCEQRFLYDEEANSEVIWLLASKKKIDVRSVSGFVQKRKLRAICK
jgi:hypothetical protein